DALELAQVREQRCDLAGDVLVDAVKTHEGVEDEQSGLEPGDGLGETVAVTLEVEPYRRRGDDVDVERGEASAGGGGDAGEALADDVQRILGGVQQHAAGLRRGESAQA